jgi:hypothetical protein
MSSSENQSAQPPQSAASPLDAPPEARLKLSPKPVPPKGPVMAQSRDSSSVTESPMSSSAVPPSEGSSPPPVAPVVEPMSDLEAELSPASLRQHPIPPASEPMQYRAIGLLYGKYTPSEEQFTRGALETEDGSIHAVLLGRVMSLVKKHVDLTKSHLWVVYPRTRDKHHDLHMQIVGIWEPENLSKAESEEATDIDAATASDQDPSVLQDGFFSVRGEVLFCSEEGDHLIVRIQQSPKKGSDRDKAFKLTLLGQITGKTVGYFWDLNVQRQGNELVVIGGRPIGLVPPRKRKAGAGAKGGPGKRPWKGPGKPGAGSSRPFRRNDASGQSGPPVPREPASKPLKRPKPGSL